MLMSVRCFLAEYQKFRHSPLLFMHLLIPISGALLFAAYFHGSVWSAVTKVSGYLEILAVAFPFLVGIIVGMAVQAEDQAGHFQLMLGTLPSKSAVYMGKLGFLLSGGIFAAALALGIFSVCCREAPTILYLKAGLLLILTMIPIYLIQLLVGLNFGKGASMGLGIAGSLISALMITGLGDHWWKWIPWAWGVRAMDYTVLAWNNPKMFWQLQKEFMTGMEISVACTVVLTIASLIWFYNWEGGNWSDN